jgi:hypothetical protein
MQDGLVLRQTSDLDDQHLKQDIRRYVEDPQDMQEVQDTRWNQAWRKDMKKRSLMHVVCKHRIDPAGPPRGTGL